MDGVPSITQCPVPGQGGSITQTFVATQYGHTWIHSHYSLQTWEGVYAPMIIHGPTTWPFDYDLGPLLLGDWLHTPVFELFEEVERTGSPNQDNVLINGVGVYSPNASDTTIPWTGERARITLVPGKTHRLQLVCTALDSTFAVSLDNHIITVIGVDFVPIHPYTTKVINTTKHQAY
jgi:FtsP/CotA-like multicopper oxidase with cupredoxin domain